MVARGASRSREAAVHEQAGARVSLEGRARLVYARTQSPMPSAGQRRRASGGEGTRGDHRCDGENADNDNASYKYPE
jgi:hypothetical protein